MRDLDPKLEKEFFDIFVDYFDLEKTSGQRFSSADYSLERMDPLADLAERPERALRIVHVAGTKGKGSTCMLLSALLVSAGYRCGTFLSPHLATVRERFLLDNRLVSYATLLQHSREFEARLRQRGLKPTLFEIMTIMAMRLFVAERCEFAVLETGIGGLLDATNYVPKPECCVITPISFDHMQLLGNTMAEIAAQKAGIIKPGVPVVCGRQPYPEAEDVIRRRAAEVGAESVAPRDDLGEWQLPGLPPFQVVNLRTVLRVCDVLGIRPRRDRFVLPELRARCECICRDPLVILDAAHNADSAQKLVAALRQLYPGTRFTVVLGVVEGKDVAGIFGALAEFAQDFVLTHPRSPHKGSELEALVRLAEPSGVPFTVVSEITSPAQLPAGRPLLFTGSFFTALIGETLFGAG